MWDPIRGRNPPSETEDPWGNQQRPQNPWDIPAPSRPPVGTWPIVPNPRPPAPIVTPPRIPGNNNPRNPPSDTESEILRSVELEGFRITTGLKVTINGVPFLSTIY